MATIRCTGSVIDYKEDPDFELDEAGHAWRPAKHPRRSGLLPPLPLPKPLLELRGERSARRVKVRSRSLEISAGVLPAA